MRGGRADRARVLVVLVGLLLPAAFVVGGPAPAAVADPTDAPGTLVSVEPTRLLDTRVGNGAPAAPVAARGTVTVQIAGRGGLPPASQVAAVFLTLTVTQPRTEGYLSARPTGGGTTGTSTLNFGAGQTVANSAMVLLGTGGALTIDNASAGSSQVIVDVTGYTRAGAATAPGTVVGVRPARLVDTRSGVGAPRAPVRPGGSIVVATLGRGGLPLAGVGGVVLNLTATATTGSGYLAVGPADSPPGQVSNLNWSRTGQTVANQVQTRVDPDGRVVVVNRGGYPVAIVADVQGYVTAGRASTADTVASFPGERAVDTRLSGGPVATTPRTVGVGGVSAMPPFDGTAGLPVAAVLVTVTVTRTTGTGYLTVWSGQGQKPTASTSNWTGAGQTVAGLVLVPLSGASHDQFAVAVTGGRADVVVDVSGYVLLDPAGAPPAVEVAATGFQQNAAHDGHAAGSLPSTAEQLWDVDFAVAGGYPEGAVVTVGHPVVTASGTYVAVHHVDAASGVDGFDLFHADAAGTVFGPITVGSDLAAVDLVAADNRLITVDSAGRVAASSLMGEAPWAQVLPYSQAEVGAAAYGGRVFVASANDLWALDTTDGHIVWQVALPAGAAAPLVSADATGVYVSGGAVDTASAYTLAGAPRWTNALGSSAGSGTPALHHGRLWARDDDGAGSGVVLDAAAGRSLRAFSSSRPVAFVQNLVLTVEAGVLVARSEADGTVVWSQGSGDIVGTPVTTDDAVYVGGSDDTLRGYAAAGGRPVWSGATPAAPAGTGDRSTGLAIGAGLLLVPNGSHLTAFG